MRPTPRRQHRGRPFSPNKHAPRLTATGAGATGLDTRFEVSVALNEGGSIWLYRSVHAPPFRAAKRMPQLLECRDQVRIALRQVSNQMDDNNNNGTGSGELAGLFAQLKRCSKRSTAGSTARHCLMTSTSAPPEGHLQRVGLDFLP
jgi:hypothetical protein